MKITVTIEGSTQEEIAAKMVEYINSIKGLALRPLPPEEKTEEPEDVHEFPD